MPRTTSNIWQGDEASGNILDAQGGSDFAIFDGTGGANTIGTTTGVFGGARTMRMTYGQYAKVARSVPTDLTFLTWYRPNSHGANRVLFGCSNASQSQYSHILSVNSSGYLEGYYYDFSYGGRTLTGSTLLSTGTYYRLGFTLGASGFLSIYVNGSSDATPMATVTPFNAWSDGPVIWLGACVPGSFGTYADGDFDQSLFSDTIWTAGTDFPADYNSGAGVAYPLGGGGGGIVLPVFMNHYRQQRAA